MVSRHDSIFLFWHKVLQEAIRVETCLHDASISGAQFRERIVQFRLDYVMPYFRLNTSPDFLSEIAYCPLLTKSLAGISTFERWEFYVKKECLIFMRCIQQLQWLLVMYIILEIITLDRNILSLCPRTFSIPLIQNIIQFHNLTCLVVHYS